MPSARSLRSFAIMALASGPETDQGDQKILCSSFWKSLLRLERVFALLGFGLPRSALRLRFDGAVDVLATLQVLKMKPVDVFVLAIYTGIKVDKKLLYNRLSQKEKLQITARMLERTREGDHLLQMSLRALILRTPFDLTPETCAALRKAAEFESFSTLEELLGLLTSVTPDIAKSLFADLPFTPSRKIGNLISSFVEKHQ
ncbi:hypothetical protein L596_020041 [Steinernema carpocapsae]|uniref:Uncharacterized protein n=1 Tax=Steinernema carpocapsae TaxID=34508 RepID=A0A4U5MT67_STECR|nr:hypothetical protein L596_020041 [Steinernema carpocapsae]